MEPVAWFYNPNIQPVVEWERRLESMRRYGRAVGLQVVVEGDHLGQDARWREWAAALARTSAEARCALCLGLRLQAAAAAAAARGSRRFSTTLSVSPYQRHDLIESAGAAAGAAHGVSFVYLDLRESYRQSYAACRRLDLYRQPYCGCAASKWEAWQQRRARRRTA